MRKHPTAEVCISINAQSILSKDICERRHIEACGLLIGHIDEQGNWHVEEARPLRNIFNSSVYFEFAPEDLLAAELDYPDQIVGVYHSHPTGLATASTTDKENMQRVNVEQQIPWVWLIISGPFTETFSLFDHAAGTAMKAYHHYEDLGLCKVALQFGGVQENTYSTQ